LKPWVDACRHEGSRAVCRLEALAARSGPRMAPVFSAEA